MPSTIETKVDSATLLASCRAAFAQFGQNSILPLDIPAVMNATALWESKGTLNVHTAEPDGSESDGLYQANQSTWAATCGAFDSDQATPGALADSQPGSGQTLAGALAYENSYIVPVLQDAQAELGSAWSILQGRITGAAGQTVKFNPALDLAVWWSICWQYGGPALLAWVKDTSGTDLTATGFAAYQQANGNVLLPDLAKRSQFMSDTYAANMSPDILGALQDSSKSWWVDLYTVAGKAVNVARMDLDAWTAQTKQLAETMGEAILQRLEDDGRKAASAVGIGLGATVLAGLLLWHVATAPAKGGGRKLHPNMEKLAKEAAIWVLPELLLAFL